MLLDELRHHRAEIETLAHKYGARKIRVFGSVARGEESSRSDIDFLVELPYGYDLFRQRLALQRSLEELTGRNVDLIPEHELNQHVQHEVLREAVDI